MSLFWYIYFVETFSQTFKSGTQLMLSLIGDVLVWSSSHLSSNIMFIEM